MKRYLTFYGDKYYPVGGMSDFVGDFVALEEAISHLENKRAQEEWENWGMVWGHIYDILEERIIWDKGKTLTSHP